jgi:hypothetical protein
MDSCVRQQVVTSLVQEVEVAVCGAHMSGLPLNKQLLDLGAQLVSRTMTSADYKLYDISQKGGCSFLLMSCAYPLPAFCLIGSFPWFQSSFALSFDPPVHQLAQMSP